SRGCCHAAGQRQRGAYQPRLGNALALAPGQRTPPGHHRLDARSAVEPAAGRDGPDLAVAATDLRHAGGGAMGVVPHPGTDPRVWRNWGAAAGRIAPGAARAQGRADAVLPREVLNPPEPVRGLPRREATPSPRGDPGWASAGMGRASFKTHPHARLVAQPLLVRIQRSAPSPATRPLAMLAVSR